MPFETVGSPIPILAALAVIAAILGGSVLASLLRPARPAPAPAQS